MRIVSLFTKYKILGELNKYSLILIYIGFVTLLLLTFSFSDYARHIVLKTKVRPSMLEETDT